MAAIFAIGNPVALLASALERDTRGFISMMTMLAGRAGSTANCTFEPPVSTPMRRMHANAASRIALVLDVGERLRGRDGDRLAGVHAHRVEVLDRADDDDVVGVVAHHLELVLLPPDDAALDQDLGDRARGEAARGDARISSAVVRDAGAAAAEDERGPDDHRVADLVARPRSASSTVYAMPDGGTAQPDLRHRGLEPLAVLGGVDRLDARADHLDVERVEHARFVQRDREVEPGLAAERRQQRVGALLAR